MRGATPPRNGLQRLPAVSIHAPRAGCDSKSVCCHCCLGVSIHAPRAGCDVSVFCVLVVSTCFNSRTPCGVRQQMGCLSYLPDCCFNSRTPCGVRHYYDTLIPQSIDVSIHAPRAGCDLWRPTGGGDFSSFNSRTPCGVRRPAMWVEETRHSFNSRTPCGVRQGYRLQAVPANRFNSRTPCGVRHEQCKEKRNQRTFQFTHPVRGATYIARGKRCPYVCFNSRTPCGVRLRCSKVRINRGLDDDPLRTEN